jgi:hypothetical protein
MRPTVTRIVLAACSVVILTAAVAIGTAGAAGWARASGPSFAPAAPTVRIEPLLPKTAFAGAGVLEAEGEASPARALTLEELSIDATTVGDSLETTVTHVFRNESDEQLEGTFRFPLPQGAIVGGLALEIDGKLIDGELVAREDARRAYEKVVDSMRDPALLEWEGGSIFTLRVFPIEPRRTKRVAIRFLAPLWRATDGLYFAYRAPKSGADHQGSAPTAEHVRLTIDGRDVPFELASTQALVKVADTVPDAILERTKDGAYLAATVRPRFEGQPPPSPTRGQALIVLCDRSRSMLEARTLQRETVSLIVAKLEPRDRFAVAIGDIGVRSFGGLHEPVPSERDAVATFLDAREPDGASDLGVLLAAGGAAGAEARAAGLDPVFVYVGDAAPTWGETRASELAHAAREALGEAPLHVVLLGVSSDDATARALTAATHGRLLRPKTADEARQAATAVVSARGARRIDDVHLLTPAGIDVPLEPPSTLYEGDELSFVAFAPQGHETGLDDVAWAGTMGGALHREGLSALAVAPGGGVARRWAAARIERLQREGDAARDEILATSLRYNVMSRYTSFLVLESEEAYARFRIARRATAARGGDDPSADSHPRDGRTAVNGETPVSGRDLEGQDERSPRVTPDHLQPGDPEIRIPAPANARSVIVDFPFGETKRAVWEDDDEGGSWVARFLVDARTPDGRYEIVVRITHADGSVEILRLSYLVDRLSPTLDVTLRPHGPGRFEIVATQRITADEVAAQAPAASTGGREHGERLAAVLTDARRVEAATPDGQRFALTPVRLGVFVGTWRLGGPVAPGSKIRLVVADRALNERTMEVEVP